MNYPDKLITGSQIAQYARDGVVVLRDIFAPYWRDLAARGIEYNLNHWGRRSFYYDPDVPQPGFFQDSCSWQRIPEYREYAFESPAAELAARLMDASVVNLFFLTMSWSRHPITKHRHRGIMMSRTGRLKVIKSAVCGCL